VVQSMEANIRKRILVTGNHTHTRTHTHYDSVLKCFVKCKTRPTEDTRFCSHLPSWKSHIVLGRVMAQAVSASYSGFPCQYQSTAILCIHVTWRMNNRSACGRSSETQSDPIDMNSSNHMLYFVSADHSKTTSD
jgi:hypothetical protein